MPDPDTKARELLARIHPYFEGDDSRLVGAIRHFAEDVAREALVRAAGYLEDVVTHPSRQGGVLYAAKVLRNEADDILRDEDEEEAARLTPPEPKGEAKPEPGAATLRPVVQRFAALMERKLRENEHKGGWSKDSAEALLLRMREEADELEEALKERFAPFEDRGGIPRSARIAAIGSEAADVANFAMMIADVFGALLAGPQGDENHDAPMVGPNETWRCVASPEPKPEPVTYRAGTVPPVVRVGMALRDSDGRTWVVADVRRNGSAALQDARPRNASARELAEMPLARDWTEPAQPEGAGERCGECDGAGDIAGPGEWLACPSCTGTGARGWCTTCGSTRFETPQ